MLSIFFDNLWDDMYDCVMHSTHLCTKEIVEAAIWDHINLHVFDVIPNRWE